MIHSPALNSSTAGEPPPSASWRPADYYESAPPAAEQRRGCRRWVAIGCGSLGCLILVLIVAFGIWMSRGGASKLIDFYFRIVEREVERNADPDVTPEQRQALKRELQRFRANISEETGGEIQPILLELNRAVRDQRLTVDEVKALTIRLRDVNDRLEKKRPAARVGAVGSQQSAVSRRAGQGVFLPTADC